MVDSTSLKRSTIVLIGIAVAAVLAVALFGLVPLSTGLGALEVLLGLLLFVGVTLLAVRIASNAVSDYDVAEVSIDGPISQSGDDPLPVPVGGRAVSAQAVTEQIERADEDDSVEALILTMNTPGGEVVASEDIRHAAERFDGPTVAYATNLCASGGMWIATGCDEFHARRGSRVGSIGVTGANFGLTGFMEKAGLEYRRFVAGEYKDTPSSFRDLREDEREYYQGLLDDFYEQFVETVVEGRDLDPETVRETEARVYLGDEAREIGLVDELGPREEMEEDLAARLGVEEITVEEFEPERGLREAVGVGARRTAYAFGAGLASVLADDGELDVRI